MRRNWTKEELIESFRITPNEFKMINSKLGVNKIAFAIIFKFFKSEARFPYNKHEIPTAIINFISKLINISSDLFKQYKLTDRTYIRYKVQIRNYFAFRESTVEDTNSIIEWLFKTQECWDQVHKWTECPIELLLFSN